MISLSKKLILVICDSILVICMLSFHSCRKEKEILSVTGFSPAAGAIGSTVIITGTGFTSVGNDIIVRFNDVPGEVTDVTPTSLTVIVPEGATSGKISVTINGNTVSTGTDFIINKPIIIIDNETINDTTFYSEKYSLLINKSKKVYKVIFSSGSSWIDSYSLDFIYSKDSIEKIKNGARIEVYYLNSHGLADSSKSVNIRRYFYYDSAGYLTSISTVHYQPGNDPPSYKTTTSYKYNNGNLAEQQSAQLTTNYYYTSYTNMINLETFEGSWLGTLNRNLVRSESWIGIHAIQNGSSFYKYSFNADSLVNKMTRIGHGSYFNRYSKTITTFEYSIVE